MEGRDPGDPGSQAEALAAARRILARLKLELLGDEDALPGAFTEEDRELLKDDSGEQQLEDLKTFATWHESLGTDPEAALLEMRERLYNQVMNQLPGS